MMLRRVGASERDLPRWEIVQVVCCSEVVEGRYTYIIFVREEKAYMHGLLVYVRSGNKLKCIQVAQRERVEILIKR